MELDQMLRELNPETNRLIYALADTSYSECCIDDVTASHAKANDAIVHFGACCLSTDNEAMDTTKTIIYVLPTPAPTNPSDWQEQARSLIDSQIIS